VIDHWDQASKVRRLEGRYRPSMAQTVTTVIQTHCIRETSIPAVLSQIDFPHYVGARRLTERSGASVPDSVRQHRVLSCKAWLAGCRSLFEVHVTLYKPKGNFSNLFPLSSPGCRGKTDKGGAPRGAENAPRPSSHSTCLKSTSNRCQR